MTDTAVAVRETPQHPIIGKIDAKMPEIAAMLPEGMSADRFRRVVVQALVRNPDLWQCTPVSVVSAIVESAQLGLEPTGVLGRAWMLPYNVKQNDGTYAKEAKLIPGYRGYAELAWRADKILVTTGAVRDGDAFEYRRGTGKYLHHIPASDDPEREADDTNITDFWAMYTLADGREDFDVMSRRAVERIRDKARKKNPVWDSDFGEMGRKTVLRRLLKAAPLSPEVQRLLARDEEVDFDTPVERVPGPKRDAIRERIASRTAAMRGESTEEPDASVPTGGAEPEAERVHDLEPEVYERGTPSASGGSPAKGDPWMRRLHAVGNERGMDHAALHDWAVEHFRVGSLSDLSTPQRATFMDLVERMPTLPSDGHPDSSGSEAATAQPDQEGSPAERSSVQAGEAGSPPSGSQPAPTLDEVLEAAGPGAEVIPPRPSSAAYKALPNGTERAKAKAWHDAQKAPEPEQKSLAEALGAPTSD